MLPTIPLLDIRKISEILGELSHRLEGLEILPSIDSTNTYLYKVYKKHTDLNAYAVLSEQQTAGRGRFNRTWIGVPGNLYLSLLVYFKKGIASLSDLYIQIGNAVIQALETSGFQGAYLKHPNDIFYEKKKLGGILIEVFGPTTGACRAIIGVGVNIYAPTKEADDAQIQQPWTAIELIQSQSIDRNLLAGLVLKNLLVIVIATTKIVQPGEE